MEDKKPDASAAPGRSTTAAGPRAQESNPTATAPPLKDPAVINPSNTAQAMYGTPEGGSKPIEFDPKQQIGRSGLKQYAGFVLEEFLPTLRGAQGAKAYREILDNCALVAGIFRQIQLSMRQVEKHVQPFSDDQEDVDRAERIEQALDDMSDSWEDVISEACTMLPYGYAPMEITYKKCSGWTDDPTTRSRYDDGLLTWRKVALRGQDTLFRWEFDDDGGVRAMLQLPPPDFILRTIPIEKMLLFRPTVEKGNPEGYSILRSAYFDWIMVKRLTEFEAIKGERDATGVPIVWTPADNLSRTPTSAQAHAAAFARKTAQNIRVDEDMGIVMPLAYDPETKQKLWDLTLLGDANAKGTGFDYDKVIQRHELRIAMSMLAGAAMLGHEKVGSFALANTKWETELAMGLNAWLDAIFAVWNRHAIPRLYALNGWPMDRMATMMHTEIRGKDVEALANAALHLSQAGMDLFPDEELENHIRVELDWPELKEGQFEEREAMAEQQAQEEKDNALQSALLHGHKLPGPPGLPGAPGAGGGLPPGAAPSMAPGRPPGAPKGKPGKSPGKGPGTGIKKGYRVRGTRGGFAPRSASTVTEHLGTVTAALRLLADRKRVGTGVDDVAHGFTSVSQFPYDASKNWRDDVEQAPLERVQLKGLIATQDTVKREGVRAFIEDPGLVPPGMRSMTGQHVDLPVVLQQGGKHYILDGHHRLAAKSLLGYPDVVARVIKGGLQANQGQPINVGGQ